MDTDDQEKELWQHYKSMADNLLSLTASLPVPLQHKAIDDLKKRLPDGNNLNSSLSSSSDETMQIKPQRRRGRPPKIAKQESVTSVQKKPLDADQPTQTTNTSFVIRTRHQRQVEQFGKQGDTPGRFRSPIVALLKTRSRRADPEGGLKKKTNVKKNSKQAAEYVKCGRKATKRKAEKSTDKSQVSNARNTKRRSRDSASDPEHIDNEHQEVSAREPQDTCEDSDMSPAKSKEKQMEGGTKQQNMVSHSSRYESSSSADPSGDLNKEKGSEVMPLHVESEPMGEQRSLNVVNADLPEAGSVSEVKSSSEACLPSQVVIVKRIPSVLPPDGDTARQQEVGCSAVELPADGEGTVKEETQDQIQALLSGTEADMSQMQQNVMDVPPPPPQQKGRRGRKLKTTADYKCPECPKMLRSRDILREHLKTHRSQYKCETCGRKFVFKFKYEAHKQVHEAGNFHKCPHCANMVMGLDRLELHIRIRHPRLEIPETCTQQKTSASPESADVSGTQTAQLSAEPAASTADEDDLAAQQPSENTSSCPIGSQNAEPTDQDSTSSQVEVTPRSDGVSRHRNRMNHVCYECKQVFRSSKKLQLHQKVAHVRMSSPCYICLRRFLYRASYDEHMDDHKKGLLKQCTVEGCSFYYKTERELQKHNARAHNKNAPRPFVCKTCNRSFWEARYLKQHVLNHDRSKTYICQTCNFVSCNLMSLRRHLASHHEMKLAHVCDLCGAKLCSKNTLHDHIKRHLNQKNVICQVCSKAFINRSQLAMHMRIHRIPRYMCSVCGKKSRTTNKLLSHMLIHTKEKPYACLVEYCNYRCRVKSNLYKHMERVHKVQHPDKYKNYHYVEQLNSCAVEVVDGADNRPESGSPAGRGGVAGATAGSSEATAPPVVVTDVLYVCAYADCGYQATTQEDVANHQLRTHEPLADAQPGDGLLGETALGFSELPIDGFDCMTIPVPVEEISDQTEAAHTLARLQSAAVMRDDLQPVDQQHRPAADAESLDNLDAIKKECSAFEAGPLAELTVSHVDIAAADDDDDAAKATPYAQLDDVLQMPTDDGVKHEDVLLCAQQTPAPTAADATDGEAPSGDEKAPPKTVYIVQVENEEGSTGSVANYLELFAKTNVINFEPGTVLVNEQGSIVSVIK